MVEYNMKAEEWNGYRIRFIEKDGEWWAILKDICDALGLRTDKVSERLDSDMLTKVKVATIRRRPSKYKEKNYDHPSKGVIKSGKENYDPISTGGIKSEEKNYEVPSKDVINSYTVVEMLAVNELGIYEALFASRRLEARKFRKWAASVMIRLRRFAGLEGYEVMQMTEKEVQDTIDCLLDDMFYDDVNDKVMVSVTVAGGDVEQMELDDYIREVEEMRRENQ